jgi:hypothetical protein
MCVFNELVCKTAKELALTSLLVALVNNMLIGDTTTIWTNGTRNGQDERQRCNERQRCRWKEGVGMTRGDTTTSWGRQEVTEPEKKRDKTK